MIKVTVNGKTRVLRAHNISFRTDHDLYCVYRGHNICISEQETGGFYVTAVDRTGNYTVQEYMGGEYCSRGIKTIIDCLTMCIENILL